MTPVANAAPSRAGFASRMIFTAFLGFVALLSPAGPARAALSASIVVEAESGRVLHSVNADVATYPASLTKMMTLYLAFQAIESHRLALGQLLPVSDYAEMQSPSKLGLKAGERISVRQAILALTTKSANDAAVVLAEGLGGTEWRFAQQMTDMAQALGMTGTVFRNASGLPDDAQITTARDMATLSRALIRDFPEQYRWFSASSFEYGGRVYESHNRLLRFYPGADGIKTGYIRASGFNLAASAERRGRRLVAVVLGGESARSRDLHVAELLDSGFAQLDAGSGGEVVSAAASPAAPAFVQPAVYRRDKGEIGVRPAQAAPSRSSRPAKAADRRLDAGDWAIQVGVFSDRASAKRIADAAARLLPALPSGAKPVTFEITSPSGKQLYRARITGVSRDAALEACRLLEQQDRECIPAEA